MLIGLLIDWSSLLIEQNIDILLQETITKIVLLSSIIEIN